MQERHKNLITKITTEEIFTDLNEERIGKKKRSMSKIYKNMSEIVGNLGSMINNWQDNMTTKRDKLVEMEDVLRAMMVGGKTDKAVQVNELELKWGIEDVIQRDVMENQPYNTSLDLASSPIALVDNSHHLVKIDPKDELQKNILKDATTAYKTQRSDEESKDSDDSSSENSSSEDSEQEKQATLNKKNKNIDAWRLPLSMVLFLETAFKTNTMVRVVPWLSLRKVIYSIYDDRLENSEFMENSIYCGHVSMEEFVSFYFLKVNNLFFFKQKKLGIEIKKSCRKPAIRVCFFIKILLQNLA